MVVVTVVAIIAAIALALFQDVQKKARLAADEATVTALRSAVAIYFGRTNGLFPASLASIGSLVTPTPSYQCTVLPVYDNANGKITFGATVNDC